MLACLHNWTYFLPAEVLASDPSQFLELTKDTLYSRRLLLLSRRKKLRETRDTARREYLHRVMVLGLALGRSWILSERSQACPPLSCGLPSLPPPLLLDTSAIYFLNLFRPLRAPPPHSPQCSHLRRDKGHGVWFYSAVAFFSSCLGFQVELEHIGLATWSRGTTSGDVLPEIKG